VVVVMECGDTKSKYLFEKKENLPMEYNIVKAYQENTQLRISFNKLAKETFDLSFENWYSNGFWRKKYIPYSIVLNREVIANVSVSKMDFTIANEKRQYLQLGTVMTKPEYRKRGYIRILIDQIKNDYADCKGIFLWANDSVRDFYPKFGFEECKEYRFQKNICGNEVTGIESVKMKDKGDWNNFLIEKSKRESMGLIKMDTDDLLMFYLSQFMQENVYYIKSLDSYVIAKIEKDTLVLYDVYANSFVDLNRVYQSFGNQIRRVQFAFTPNDTIDLLKYKYKEEDSTFFIMGEGIEEDMQRILSFPQIAHA